MTFAVHVQGGTGAGVKRPLKERRWTHVCKTAPLEGGRVLACYSCPDCGARRPT